MGVGAVLGLAVVVVGVGVLDPLGGRESPGGEDADTSTTLPPPDEAVGSSAQALESPDPSVFGGPAALRLPDDVMTLWSVDLPGSGPQWIEVVRRELVLVAFEGSGGRGPGRPRADTSGTTVIAFDALTGSRRWSIRFAVQPRDVVVVGAVDDVVVLERAGARGATVAGVEIETGRARWRTTRTPNLGHVALDGTGLVARLPSPPDRWVALIDAGSGREIDRIVSRPELPGQPGGWFTDRDGTWYQLRGRKVVSVDLRSPRAEPTTVGEVRDPTAPRIALDGRMVTVGDDGAIRFDGDGRTRPAVDVPLPVRSLTAISDSSFVVTAPGEIVGVTVDGDRARVTWRREFGVIVAEHPVEDGTLLRLATRGGAAMELVDGLTGETVEHLAMRPGALPSLLVAGDGMVVLQTSELDGRLVALDLDGTERWSLAGAAPLAIGDRVVARAVDGRLTAYGDPP